MLVFFVYDGDEVFGGGDEPAVFETEEDVEGAVIDAGDAAYRLATVIVDDVEAYNGGPGDGAVVAVDKGTGKPDIAACQFPGAFLSVDVRTSQWRWCRCGNGIPP